MRKTRRRTVDLVTASLMIAEGDTAGVDMSDNVEVRINRIFTLLDEDAGPNGPVEFLTRDRVNFLIRDLSVLRGLRVRAKQPRHENQYQLEKDLHWLRGVMLRNGLTKITR